MWIFCNIQKSKIFDSHGEIVTVIVRSQAQVVVHVPPWSVEYYTTIIRRELVRARGHRGHCLYPASWVLGSQDPVHMYFPRKRKSGQDRIQNPIRDSKGEKENILPKIYTSVEEYKMQILILGTLGVTSVIVSKTDSFEPG